MSDDPTTNPTVRGSPVIDPIIPVIDPTIPMFETGDVGPDKPAPHPTDFLTIHPNALVAITTARIAQNQTPEANTRVNTLNPTHPRFILFLDALASLAVSDDKGQVVAMAMQIINAEMTITISENTVVEPELVDYIKKLVEILEKISTAKPDEIPGMQLDFYQTTYGHSLSKLYKRFHRRSWLQKFDVEFAKKVGEDELKCQVVLSALLTAFEVISAIKEKKVANKEADPKVVKDEDWNTLMFMMSSAIPNVEYLLNHSTLCQTWAEELKGTISNPPSHFNCGLLISVLGTVSVKKTIAETDDSLPVPLFRAIEKLTSHHRHVLLLFEYATSVDGRRDLESKFNYPTRPASDVKPTVAIPDIDELNTALRLILPNKPDLSGEVDLVTTGIKDQLRIELGGSLPSPVVHCECALIAYLNENPHTEDWPVRYIGVSKLSCAACYSWIQAFNDSHVAQYQTRGCHGRWYPGWAMPAAPKNMTDEKKKEEVDMQHKMNAIVGQAYRQFADAGGDTRPVALSDSTEAKARFPTMVWDMADMKKAIRLSNEKRDKRAATVSTGKKQPVKK